MDKKIIISQETVKRIVKDIKDIIKNKEEFKKEGIYYIHDEINILKGYILIIGPLNTPYAHGFYFFEINFSNDYPFTPPKVIFNTNDGFTRFNPNLYINGKVCLSILNTWRGEQWTSCQTLRSILLTLVSILNNEPLTNEPGITRTHKDFDNYNKIITYKNLSFSLYKQLFKKKIPHVFNVFLNDMEEYYNKNSKEIIDIITNLNINYPTEEIIKTGTYNMVCKINYKKLLNLILTN